ncbi:hypothetical protein Esti_004068 [Eimeria stiedai]
MAAGMTTEELRALARAAGLSTSEENFVCFDWTGSEAWQEYLSNLYPTPPLNKLLKWKKKFYKTHQDPSFDVNSTKVDDVLRGEAKPAAMGPQYSSSSWHPSSPHVAPVGNPPSARALVFLTPLSFICLLAGMLKTVVAAAASARDPGGTLLFTFGLLLRIYCCFGLPPIKLRPLSQLGDSIANRGFPYFQASASQVLQSDAMHGVLFFFLTGMMPSFLPAVASPLLTGCLIVAQIFREGSGIPSFFTSILGEVETSITLVACVRQRFQILQLRADLELYYGLFFVAWSVIRMHISLAEFLLPAYLYWQLQKLRYQLCPFSQASFRRVDAAITSVTNHRSCPRIVGVFYNTIRNFCIRQVQPPDPAPAGQSSSCTIMALHHKEGDLPSLLCVSSIENTILAFIGHHELSSEKNIEETCSSLNLPLRQFAESETQVAVLAAICRCTAVVIGQLLNEVARVRS